MNEIYAHRRIKAELAAMGHVCGRHRVTRLMREAGLRVRSRKRWRLVFSGRRARSLFTRCRRLGDAPPFKFGELL
ncbi:IS3 family transposase [Pseudomonas sp. Bi70]|uniref:IS3 family transposase n=1 Tax=Pseudomonas sp. Bi70 TaxID=2821127 RepID=UPI003442E755